MHSFASLHSRPVPGTSPIDSAAFVAIEPAVEFVLVGLLVLVPLEVLLLAPAEVAASRSTDASNTGADAEAGSAAEAAVEFNAELDVALLIRSTRVVRSCLLARSWYVPWSTIDPSGPFSPGAMRKLTGEDQMYNLLLQVLLRIQIECRLNVIAPIEVWRNIQFTCNFECQNVEYAGGPS
jgi:hypothetical protein